MWTLILVFALVDSLDRGLAVATSTIPGFSSKQTCEVAWKSVKDIKRYACVEVK